MAFPLVEKLFQNAWNKGQLEVLHEILSPNFTLHASGNDFHGIEVMQNIIKTWREAFPDIHHEIDDTIIADDKIIARWHGEGTQKGIFMGFNASGRKMSYSGITIFQVKNNQLTDAWVSANVTSILQQLEVYSDKRYTEKDFDVDFKGPAKEIYRWLMKARETPACKQKMANALRDQFSHIPLDNNPPIIPSAEIMSQVTAKEIFIPTTNGSVRGLLYHPKIGEKKLLPLVIYMHGGGWSIGNAEEAEFLSRKLAFTSEVVVLNLDYRLAPEHPYPNGLDDCIRAYEWAREHARSELNANPEKIAVGGDSSGGNFALAIALRLRDEGKKIPNAILALCPLTDFKFEKYPSALKVGPNSLLYDFAFLNFVRSIYSPYDLWEHPYVSPMYGEFANFPPTFILSAGQDLLIDENKIFADKLKKANVDVSLLIHEAMPHAYYYYLGFTKDEELAYQAFAKFLKKVFG